MEVDNIVDLFDEIQEVMAAHAHVDNAGHMSAYMKNRYRFYGLKSTLRRNLLKPLIKYVRPWAMDDIFQLVGKLWQEDHRESQYTAMDILDKNIKKLESRHMSDIEYLITTKSWWDTVDKLSSHQVGQLWKNDIELRDMTWSKWIQSDNIWLNRPCLIFQLLYKEETDFELMKSSILAVRHKNDFFIQKAIGWCLRQYSRTDKEAVRNFVLSKKLSTLAFREAKKYLDLDRDEF